MAGMFYSLQEAAEKLNISEDQLKEFVQEGKLREFRDGPNLLFKVDEVEALIPDHVPDAVHGEVAEPEVPEPEIAVPEAEEEPVELDLSMPEAEEPEVPEGTPKGAAELDVPDEGTEVELEIPDEGTEVELEIPEPVAEEPEAVEAKIPEPEAEVSVPGTPPQGVPNGTGGEPEEIEDISELEALSDSDVPSLEDIEAEMAEVQEPTAEEPEAEEVIPEVPTAEAPEPEVPEASETASDSEILLAPETGAPLMSSDLTDADTALTGLGTNVLGETDQDYEITDDTMAETAVPMGTGGTTPEVPLEEIEGDVNLDTFGSGSGLLDLSLQADDTSLGGILDEIYTADEEGKDLGEAEGDSAAAMVAEADQMVPEEELAVTPAAPEMAAIAGPMIELAPDAQSNTLGMLLFLPLLILIYTTVVAIAGELEVMPSIVSSIQAFIWYIMGGAAVVAGLVVVAAFMFTGERSAAPKAKKEKKVKVKKEKKPKEPKKPKEKKPKKAKKGFLRLK
jgi:excisionase family DNA binding protein